MDVRYETRVFRVGSDEPELVGFWETLDDAQFQADLELSVYGTPLQDEVPVRAVDVLRRATNGQAVYIDRVYLNRVDDACVNTPFAEGFEAA